MSMYPVTHKKPFIFMEYLTEKNLSFHIRMADISYLPCPSLSKLLSSVNLSAFSRQCTATLSNNDLLNKENQELSEADLLKMS